AAAGLWLRAAAHGLSHHPAAADIGIPQHHQEQCRRPHHRPDGAHGAGAVDAGVLVPGVRGVHRRDRHLHRHQRRGDLCDALRCRLISERRQAQRPGEGAMFGNFDYDVIIRSLPYLFYDGMTFTLTLTALATVGGIAFGTVLALMRLSGIAPLSLVAAGYVN